MILNHAFRYQNEHKFKLNFKISQKSFNQVILNWSLYFWNFFATINNAPSFSPPHAIKKMQEKKKKKKKRLMLGMMMMIMTKRREATKRSNLNNVHCSGN